MSIAPHGFVVSPFRVKGVVYLGTQSYFAKRPGGLGRVCEALADERLAAFISQRFLPGSLYEVMHVPALLEAEARAMQTTVEDYLVDRSRFQAGLDTSGVYRLLLRLTNPETVLERLPRLMTQVFNFGEGTTTITGKRERRLAIDGIPRALAPWLSVAIRVYVETTVMRSGASGSFVAPVNVLARAPRDGFEMCALETEISWK